MGGIHAFVGFLDNSNSLKCVDKNIRGLAFQSYHIPGFGSYGVSCSGHYREDLENDFFEPQLFGDIGFDALPELTHVKELISLMNNLIIKDGDANIYLQGNGAPRDWPIYDTKTDLLSHCRSKTIAGLARLHFKILIGDNGALDKFKDKGYITNYHFQIKGNEDVYEKSKLRMSEIHTLWSNLENLLTDFNKDHSFNVPDFNKQEFYMR